MVNWLVPGAWRDARPGFPSRAFCVVGRAGWS